MDRHASENTLKLLVGNKADLTEQKEVPEDTARQFADTLGIPFIETSSKTATNVDAAFLTLTRALVQAQTPAANGGDTGKQTGGSSVNVAGSGSGKKPGCC